MRTITCKIPEGLDAELETISAKQGVTKSEFVRKAIEQNIDRETAQARLSAYDVMKEACGIVKDGPRDLTTNPRHLRGVGRD